MLRYGIGQARHALRVRDRRRHRRAARDRVQRRSAGVIDAGGVVRGLRLPGSAGVLAQGLRRPGGVRQVVGRQGRGVAAGRPGGEIALADRQVPERGRAGGDRRPDVGAAEGDTVFLVADAARCGRARAGAAAAAPGRAAGADRGGLELPVDDRLSRCSSGCPRRTAGRRRTTRSPRPRRSGRTTSTVEPAGGPIAPVRPRPERQRGRRRLDAETTRWRCSSASSTLLGISRGGGRAEVLVPAAGAVDGRAAARRHRVRPRPAGDAACRCRLAARRDRVPQGPGRRRLAHRRSHRGHSGRVAASTASRWCRNRTMSARV